MKGNIYQLLEIYMPSNYLNVLLDKYTLSIRLTFSWSLAAMKLEFWTPLR
jgi:hypothetical protein